MKKLLLLSVVVLAGLSACKKDEYPIRPTNVVQVNYIVEDPYTDFPEFDEVRAYLYNYQRPMILQPYSDSEQTQSDRVGQLIPINQLVEIGRGSSSGRNFRLTLSDPVPDECLFDVTDVYYNVTISDEQARISYYQPIFIFFQNGEQIEDYYNLTCYGYESSNDEKIIVQYVYSDRDVRITGSTENESQKEIIDTNLKRGWNRTAIRTEYEQGLRIYSETNNIPLIRLWHYWRPGVD